MKPAFTLLDEMALPASNESSMDMNSTLSMILQPTSFDAEQLKALATNIVQEKSGISPGVIMVANAVSKDDKGLVAANLALSIAESSDKHVFLIDCDTVSPSVHSFFKNDNKLGLYEYLSHDQPLSSVIKKTKSNKLRLLTSGNGQHCTDGLIDSEKMSRFINELKEKCPELVMVLNIDSTQLSDETNSVQALADGIVLSVDEGVHGSKLTKDVLSKTSKKKLLGVIKKCVSQKKTVAVEPEIDRQFEKTVQFVMPVSDEGYPEIDRQFEKTVQLMMPVSDEGHPEIERQFEKTVQLMIPRRDLDASADSVTDIMLPVPSTLKPAKTILKELGHPTSIARIKETLPVLFQEKLVAKRSPDSFESEQFKMVTAHVMQLNKDKNAQVYMVTSSSPGEGKSFVASNLASSLAENTDKKVLIIDCDLRSPSVHTLFGQESETGLSDYLAGNIPLASLCLPSGIEDLSILQAGRCESNSFKLLSSEKMEKLIKGLKQRFKDLIIIMDVASPALLAEGNVLAKYVDGIAIVASHNQTRRNEIKKLVEMFDKEKIVGVIYNKFRPQSSILNKCKRYFTWFTRG